MSTDATAPLTPGQRWDALKDYLRDRIDSDLAVSQEARAAGYTGTANAHGALVSANRSTLAKMRELEAGLVGVFRTFAEAHAEAGQ